MLIYEALKKDHEKVKSLLNELVNLDDDSDQRDELITQIRDELIPHARAEEAVFYNSLRTFEADKELVRDAYKEHIEAEKLLKMLQMKDAVNIDWKKTASELLKALEHHIQEEEGPMFTRAREVFTDDEARQFAEAFEKMKPEIKEEGFVGTTLDLAKNLMPPRFNKYLSGESSRQSEI